MQGSSGLVIVSSFYSSFFSGDDKQNRKWRQKTVKEIMLNRGMSSTDKKTVRQIIMLNRVGVRLRQTSD